MADRGPEAVDNEVVPGVREVSEWNVKKDAQGYPTMECPDCGEDMSHELTRPNSWDGPSQERFICWPCGRILRRFHETA